MKSLYCKNKEDPNEWNKRGFAIATDLFVIVVAYYCEHNNTLLSVSEEIEDIPLNDNQKTTPISPSGSSEIKKDTYSYFHCFVSESLLKLKIGINCICGFLAKHLGTKDDSDELNKIEYSKIIAGPVCNSIEKLQSEIQSST